MPTQDENIIVYISGDNIPKKSNRKGDGNGKGNGGGMGIRTQRAINDLAESSAISRQQKSLPLIGIATHFLRKKFATTISPVTTTTTTTALVQNRNGRALPLALPLAPLVLSGGITLGKESLTFLAPYLFKGTLYEIIVSSYDTEIYIYINMYLLISSPGFKNQRVLTSLDHWS